MNSSSTPPAPASAALARAAASNVLDLQAERQRRAARRMALQTIAVLCNYPGLHSFVRIG